MTTVCGTVQGLTGNDVRVIIERKAACQGCQSMNVCHGFTKTSMDLVLPRPEQPVGVGDTVVISMEGSSVIKASACAFLIPLLAVLAGLFIARMISPDIAIQAAGALLAFAASLVIVRFMGKKIETPRIIEVVHEE